MNEDELPYSWFLGPKSEQRKFLKEFLELIFDDYIYWRRNYHPKDPPAIPYEFDSRENVIRFRERFTQELFGLISDLKLDVPFFSPRYMAHIVPEVSLPGLAGYLAAFLYNPNNVSAEASPVTIRYEMEVGRQFAVLFGYDAGKAFGHLTSGGTVANYESIWYQRAAMNFPLTLRLLEQEGLIDLPEDFPRRVFDLMNMAPAALLPVLRRILERHGDHGAFWQHVQRLGLAGQGEVGFRRLVEEKLGEAVADPVLIVPATAHYSWMKAADLFGVGRVNLLKVAVDGAFRMDPADLGRILGECRRNGRPVLQMVSVLGTTEFGSVDPLAEIIAERDRLADQGFYVPVHVDAAFGGYFATMFRSATGAPPASWASFFSPEIQRNFAALSACDSVTVDPHKMGFVPYGAGSFVLKHGLLRHLVQESAPYLGRQPEQEILQSPGSYILEGSKPGAAAASVWFTHRMIPLDQTGFGQLLYNLCRLTRQFHDEMLQHNETMAAAGRNLRFIPVCRPETNVLVFLAARNSVNRPDDLNQLNGHLIRRFGLRTTRSVQSYDYLVSHTEIGPDGDLANRLFGQEVSGGVKLQVMRLVFMNQWVQGKEYRGTPYFLDFLQCLERACCDPDLQEASG